MADNVHAAQRRLEPQFDEFRPPAPTIEINAFSAESNKIGPVAAGGPDIHIILLHGHGNKPGDMQRWVDAILGYHAPYSFAWHNIAYDWSKPFTTAATEVVNWIRQQTNAGANFRDIRFLGYSMGGAVARQAVALGVPVTRLVSVSTPHLGLLYEGFPYWTPVVGQHDDGCQSLLRGSQDLANLNNNHMEASMRNRYMFAGATYASNGTNHPDDMAVEIGSALGNGLGPIQPYKVNLTYDGLIVNPLDPNMPHMCGMNPKYYPRVLDFLLR